MFYWAKGQDRHCPVPEGVLGSSPCCFFVLGGGGLLRLDLGFLLLGTLIAADPSDPQRMMQQPHHCPHRHPWLLPEGFSRFLSAPSTNAPGPGETSARAAFPDSSDDVWAASRRLLNQSGFFGVSLLLFMLSGHHTYSSTIPILKDHS